MSAFDLQRTIASVAITEIVANAEAQHSFPAFVTKHSAQLFDYAMGEDKKHFKQELQNLLKERSPDPTVVYRGLLIQLNGIFEGFIKTLIAAHVAAVAVKAIKFSDLEEGMKAAYSAHAGRVLSHILEGSLNGVSYEFAPLQQSLGACFSDASPFEIRGEVFTALMGNCTPERLERVFEQVNLPDPFGDPIGRHKAVQELYRDGKVRRAANRLRDDLSQQIKIRNDLVHGLATKTVLISDVHQAANLFMAMIEAYSDSFA